MSPFPILLIDIDGLRPDVFTRALAAGDLPNIARLLGGPEMARGVQIPILAPAPSITFCSQACLFTGLHPRQHGIPGNQFFDRFGTNNNGIPRHFAFDVGDTLAVDDAVRVFTDGLAAKRVIGSTFYEHMAEHGRTSVVAGNMYAKGANVWLKPALAHLARFTKGGNLFGMSSREYDEQILQQAVGYLHEHGMPDVLTMYFMGLDHDSHAYGPHKGQAPYLIDHIDPMIGKLWEAVLGNAPAPPFVALFSDHGQIEVIPDDKHSLRIGFPFDREMGYLFSALGLDVHDFPGEDPNCDAVMALNGGTASVYLQNQTGHWADQPDFQRDVLPVGKAFWEAHQTGRHATELHGALAGVLLRNTARDGWQARYQALTPEGHIVGLEKWFAGQPAGLYADPVHRLNNYAGLYTGDLLLISNYAEGYYFGGEITGVHGGLHPEDSRATLAYGWPGAAAETWEAAKTALTSAIAARCQSEGGRQPTASDMLVGVEAVIASP